MRSNTTIALLTRLWRDYMRQYWRLYLVAVFCMIIVGGMTAAMVRLVEPTLDIAFINKDQRLIITMALAFFLCAVIRGIANFGQSVLLYQIGFKIIESIQNQMFQTLQSADLQFFLRQGTSSQISRFTNDVTQLRLGLAKIFLSFGRDCSVLIFMCWTMISLNREMAFVVLALLPVTVVPIIWIGKQIRRLSRKTQNELSTMTSMLDDALKSIRQTIIYNRQDIEKARARTIFANVFDLSYRAARYSALNYPIMDLIGGAIMGGIILWGGMLILDGELSVGQFMAFFVAIISAYQPVRSLSKLNASLQEGLAATDRVFQLLDAKDLQTSEQEERQLVPTKHGDMAFENVGFSYKDDPQMIVKGISLQFPTESITAIIGPSGSGKSTIMNLIAKLYEPTEGHIYYDGQDITQCDGNSLRENIAFLAQDTVLFDATIAENIAFGNPDANAQDIKQAALQAGLNPHLWQEGLETRVGEMGVRLSGGQRQRIALARAIVKGASILLLDEPTAALDETTEMQIWEDLLPIIADKTTILVTHRLHLLSYCTQAFVIKKGEVVEKFDHTSLQQQSKWLDVMKLL